MSQTIAASAISESLGLLGDRRQRVEELFHHAQVERRFSVLDAETLGLPRSLSQSMELYRHHATELGIRAASDCLSLAELKPEDIDMVVTCSCTGVLLPSLSVLVAQGLGLRGDVRRVPLTEVGCAGGASALARADEFVRAYRGSRVLVVAVELPTLTLQSQDRSTANLIASAIFGDGAAAALVSDDVHRPKGGAEILATCTETLPSSAGDLGFDLRDGGMHIVLSKHVPRIVSEHMPRVVDQFLERQGLTREQLSFFVLHPGGRKVLDCLESSLHLQTEQTKVSREVLRDYGNQSSAAVLFVLEQALRGGRAQGHGLLAAVGPGITLELSLLRGGTC